MALGTATVPYDMRFDAGRICLDLLSTSHPEERLNSLAPLCAWITGSGLVPPGTPLAHADASWLVAFHELRGWVGRLVRDCLAEAPRPHDPALARPHDPALARPHDPALARPHDSALARPHDSALARPHDPALARLNDLARTPPPAPRAVRGEDGTLVRELAGPPECAALLAAVARDAVDLLTDPGARASLRRCEGDNCPIVYLDSSRGHRRRWCSSEVCGNRERVARHRRRAALARA
ncbi:ABATE domain-containing protein [Streptomyces sp. Li-HN-5-11]|uniref:CGNR zinc finger domain-containing protein n=1 Tax=Streptomyces sp. Li-HN-5-11 TaxID=3075432 RepID=UPI0028AD85FD|nr:ABATE domain-containing protein [Streptomyces sp. Li-HN-5-11]WNM35433.1 ABATE domain-containing protein [Streptomyces sp. Li-HN-5-11]